MKRLFYEKVVNDMLKLVPTIADEMGLEADYRYLHYHNEVCPCCLGKFKLSHDRTVKKIGSISWGALTSPQYKKLVPYVLCRDCIVGIDNDKTTIIEDYIIKTLGL